MHMPSRDDLLQMVHRTKNHIPMYIEGMCCSRKSILNGAGPAGYQKIYGFWRDDGGNHPKMNFE